MKNGKPIFHNHECDAGGAHELTARCDADGNGYTACNKCGSIWHNPDSIYCKKRAMNEERETAHDLLVELVEIVKTFPAEITGDYDDLGDRIKIYLGEED